jgi:hypothetical protein
VKRRVVVIALWSLTVGLAGLYYGGGQVAPCVGGLGTNQGCVQAWRASHPAPLPVLDITMPWPWLALYVLGLITILAIGRLRAPRQSR